MRERPLDEISDDDANRLTWQIINELGIPYSIDADGCLHVDMEALDRQRAELDVELNDNDEPD